MYSQYYLIHEGVKGQRWGVRRYQNEDGSYKSGAEGRYDPPSEGHLKSKYRAYTQNRDERVKARRERTIAKLDYKIAKEQKKKELKQLKAENKYGNIMNMNQPYSKMKEDTKDKQKIGSDFVKKAIIAGAVVGGTYLVAKQLNKSGVDIKDLGKSVKYKVGSAINNVKDAKQRKIADKAYKQALSKAYTTVKPSNGSSNLFSNNYASALSNIKTANENYKASEKAKDSAAEFFKQQRANKDKIEASASMVKNMSNKKISDFNTAYDDIEKLTQKLIKQNSNMLNN